MDFKIYRHDNYIVVTNNTTQETFYGHTKEVFVDKSNTNRGSYTIYNVKDFDPVKYPLTIEHTLKEDGSASDTDDVIQIQNGAGVTTLSITGNGKLKIPTGASSSVGNATLVGGVIAVNTVAVTTNSVVQLTRKTFGGTIGELTYTVAVGVLTITSRDRTTGLSVADTSTVSYLIIN